MLGEALAHGLGDLPGHLLDIPDEGGFLPHRSFQFIKGRPRLGWPQGKGREGSGGGAARQHGVSLDGLRETTWLRLVPIGCPGVAVLRKIIRSNHNKYMGMG